MRNPSLHRCWLCMKFKSNSASYAAVLRLLSLKFSTWIYEHSTFRYHGITRMDALSGARAYTTTSSLWSTIYVSEHIITCAPRTEGDCFPWFPQIILCRCLTKETIHPFGNRSCGGAVLGRKHDPPIFNFMYLLPHESLTNNWIHVLLPVAMGNIRFCYHTISSCECSWHLQCAPVSIRRELILYLHDIPGFLHLLAGILVTVDARVSHLQSYGSRMWIEESEDKSNQGTWDTLANCIDMHRDGYQNTYT